MNSASDCPQSLSQCTLYPTASRADPITEPAVGMGVVSTRSFAFKEPLSRHCIRKDPRCSHTPTPSPWIPLNYRTEEGREINGTLASNPHLNTGTTTLVRRGPQPVAQLLEFSHLICGLSVLVKATLVVQCDS